MSPSRMWLTPVRIDDGTQQIVLQADRLELLPTPARDRFLAVTKSVHPRMMVAFKSNLLLSEEAELACGVDELPFDLAGGEPVEFGPDTLELSHCALAYMDRLPSSHEMDQWIAEAAGQLADDPDSLVVRQWLDKMHWWLQTGNSITLLREES
jgi:hypothetical protein